MKEKVISFLNSRNRGFHPELAAIKSGLLETAQDLEFRYFLKADQTKNPLVNQGVSFEKEVFCKQAKHILCVDDSLPEAIASCEDINKVLFAVPFDYQFSRMMLADENKNEINADFNKYSYMFTGSKFTSEVLARCYDTSGVTLVDGVCHPLGYKISKPEEQKAVRENLEYYFPGMKGKKVLSIVTAGKKVLEDATVNTMDLNGFMDELKDDWFVLTNDSVLHERAQELPVEYVASFGYVKDMVLANKLLYVADALVTNSGSFIGAFAATRKPMFWLRQSNNPFEKYMAKKYAHLDFSNVIEAGCDGLGKADMAFCEYFSYGTENSPIKKLEELLGF